MKAGGLSGFLWGLDTVVLGIALGMAPLLGAGQASIVSAFLHDLACVLLLLVYMGVRGRLADTVRAARTRSGLAVMGAAVLGGPLGMTGYLVAINNIGAGYTAIISAFYPAVGATMAFLLLHERMRPRQFVALLVALGAVVLMGWSSTAAETAGNAALGLAGAALCVFGWGSEAVILAWGMRDAAVDNETALQIRETTSAVIYGAILVPLIGAFPFATTTVLTPAAGVVAVAAIAGTASYLFYYKAIDQIGAARGMALNISYSAWAVVFGLVLLHTVPSLLQAVCCAVIIVGTVLSASSDWNELRPSRWSGRGGAASGTVAAAGSASERTAASADA